MKREKAGNTTGNTGLNPRALKCNLPPSRAKSLECPMPAKAGNCSFEARGFSPVFSVFLLPSLLILPLHA